ncbi:MAG: ABC transporter ATP-binding protein [Actinomycetota bacterium]
MTSTDAPALGMRLEGVRKSFGVQVALAGVDLEIPQGSSVAIMGPNGAGKTTLLKTMAGLAAPTAGNVSLAGVDLRRAGAGLRALVGFVSHEAMLYPDLTVHENLEFFARLFGLPQPEKAIQIRVEQLKLGHVLDRAVRALSRGTRQRAAIARSLLHSPLVLLLDEPYTGLDEAAAESLTDLLNELRTPDRTLVMAVHEMSRAVAVAERLIVIGDGRVKIDSPIAGQQEELASTYMSLLRAAAEVRL